MRLPRWYPWKSVRTGPSWVEWFIIQVGEIGLWLLRLPRALCWKFSVQYLSPWRYAELKTTNLFCEPVICLHFSQYSLFRWKRSFCGAYPFKMQETIGGRRVEAERDQERCWCHLGTWRAPLPQVNLPDGANYFLWLPTNRGKAATLWCLCGFPMVFTSSGSFAQALSKVNHV